MNFSEFEKQTASKLDESSTVVPKEQPKKLTAFDIYTKGKVVPTETAKPSATPDTSQLSNITASPNVDITKILASNKKVEKKANKDATKRITEGKKDDDDDDDDDETDNDEVKPVKSKRHVNSSAKKAQNYRDPNTKKLKTRSVPIKDNVVKEDFNFAMYLEDKHRDKVYKGAEKPQDFQNDWSPLQKKLYDMHKIKVDPNADINVAIDKNQSEVKKTMTLKPKTRKGDNMKGDPAPKPKEIK